jgi:hypothetical protein
VTRALIGGALLGKVLSQFYKSVEKLGFVAGGEFKAAVEEGKCKESTLLWEIQFDSFSVISFIKCQLLSS